MPAKQMPAADFCLWVGAGMACCIGADYVVGVLSALSQTTGYELTQPDSPDITSVFGCLVAVVATAIVPAICEEFALRCCALGIVKKYGKAFGVVAVSIVFGLIHGNIIQFIFATLVGLILGYVTVRTNSVVPAMFIHGLNNGMSVVCSIVQYAIGENAVDVANYALFGFWLVAGGICIVILAVKKQIVFKLDAQDNTPYANTTAQKLGAFFSSPVLILSALYFVVSVITSIKRCDMQGFMQRAAELAAISAAEGEVPVGAVVVKNGIIVGEGRNRRELSKNALSHAEIEAINNACRTLGGWRLWQCELFVTLEPCPMCAGAIINSRIKRLLSAHMIIRRAPSVPL